MTARTTTTRRHRATAVTAAAALVVGTALVAAAPAPRHGHGHGHGPRHGHHHGHEPARIADSLVELIEPELARDDLSTFERDVLQRAVDTGRIEQADYDEAVDRYLACMSDAGFAETRRRLLNGLDQLTLVQPDGVDGTAYLLAYIDAADVCATGTTKRVEAYFALQQGNPDLLADPFEAAVRCLAAYGLVDARVTARRLERLLTSGVDAAPFDVMSLEAQTCFLGVGLAVVVDDRASPTS